MLNQSDMRLVRKLEGVDLFLGGHEHCYMIYKNQNSIGLKSGSNFECFNEIIIEQNEDRIAETIETKEDCV